MAVIELVDRDINAKKIDIKKKTADKKTETTTEAQPKVDPKKNKTNK